MSEQEEAEEFCRTLDALLEGRASPRPGDDPGALQLARSLAQADFSAESRVRAALRAQLLESAQRGRRAVWVYAPLALSLAVLALMLVLPFSTHRKDLNLAISGCSPSDAAGERAEIFETAPARVESHANGGRIAWEIGGATYVLETRRVSLDDIFQKPEL